MTRSKVICIALTCAIAGASVGLAQDKSLPKTLDELLPGMGAEKIPDRRGAQQQWQEICFQAGAPGNEAKRTEVCELMVEKIGPDTARPARIWLLTQLERIGRGESVDAVAALLDDKDPHVRDGARRALTNNPAPEADRKLLAKLQGAGDNQLKIGLLNSLGYRADAASVAEVARELANKDQGVAAAAARALGKISTADAAQALAAVRSKVKGDVHFRITDSYLLCADSLLRQGKTKEAAAIYNELKKADEAKSIRLAAVQGLLKVAGKKWRDHGATSKARWIDGALVPTLCVGTHGLDASRPDQGRKAAIHLRSHAKRGNEDANAPPLAQAYLRRCLLVTPLP